MTERELNDAIAHHRERFEAHLSMYDHAMLDGAKARYLADAALHASVLTALIHIADGK